MELNKAHTKGTNSCDEPSGDKAQVNDSSTNTGQSPRASGNITEPVTPLRKDEDEEGQPLTPRNEPSINEEEGNEPSTSHDMMAIMAATVHGDREGQDGNTTAKEEAARD
ncbi:hypothetical protein BGZ61DRAFT_483387 [Ilyonectria robusta]|uniref:uncharacterized protein n=1 Tax=Ilyonectria robusta TaxID=1079257 RepID=UPI001E8E9776|nr:uncharacterized protein BGZ61DRAFT_483387 [Ilyonectria robusta]KAH8669194.1 hypothetical protein BGZ61DRAFT_483387 [Ilyonectria robusta]